jgi:tRNA dimethylallyltransferase
LAAAAHHFIGFLPLEARFSAGDFARAAREKAEDIFLTKDIVIAAGGSGLYLKALTEGFDDLPHDPAIRQQVIDLHREQGLEALTAQLRSLDPDYSEKADMQNTQRVMRALEVCRASGRPYSSFLKGQKEALPWRVLWLGLSDEREIIYERINRRVDAMVEAGLEEEAHRLLPFRHLNSLRTVGYSEWFAHFDGLCTRDEAIEQIKQNTRRFAKRQLTWFKANPDIRWFKPDEMEAIDAWLASK